MKKKNNEKVLRTYAYVRRGSEKRVEQTQSTNLFTSKLEQDFNC